MNSSQQVDEKEENAATHVAQKVSKAPTLYVSIGELSNDIKDSVLKPLLDGLSKLNINIMTHEDETADKAMTKSNILLLLQEDEAVLKEAWENGVVPITMPFSSKVQDYNPNTESGNSFVFKNKNKWEVFAAVVRAIETFKFPYDWKFIMTSCKKSAR